MKIKIPGHGPAAIYSDTYPFMSIPGEGAIEVSEIMYLLRDDFTSINPLAAFARASIKPDFQIGSDTITNSPQYETVLTPGYQDKASIANHADGAVAASCVDKTGKVWGFLGTRAGTKVYSLDPATDLWSVNKDFGAGNKVSNIFSSQKTGYVFACICTAAVGSANTTIYRSVSAGAVDDWTLVLTMDGYALSIQQWCFTDHTDGKIWMSEYGGAKAGDIHDACRIYYSDDEGATWATVLNFFNDADISGDFHAGIHLHKIIYNPTNDTLYMAHGDTDPNYIYKSISGGAWAKAGDGKYEIYTGAYSYLQPTAAVVLPDGNILWFDDANRYGLQHHNITTDAFTYYNCGNTVLANFYDAKIFGNVIIAANYAASGSGTVNLLAISPSDPSNFVVIDYDTGAVGGQNIAGLASNGYVYISSIISGALGTKKYKLPVLTSKVGLSIDPVSGNGALDPFGDVGADGWGDYSATYYEATGGKYSGDGGAAPHFIVHLTPNVNFVPIANKTDPVVVSFWAKRRSVHAATAYLRFQVRTYKDATLKDSGPYYSAVADDYRMPNSNWHRFSVVVDLTNGTNYPTADVNKVLVRFSIPSTGDYDIDCLHVEQSTQGRVKLPRLAAGNAADSLITTMSQALPATCSIVGITSSRYQFDAIGTYSIFEAKNAAGTAWIKLVVNNGYVHLIDDSHAVGAAIISAAIPTQTALSTTGNGDPPPDVYYWALVFYDDAGTKKAALHLSTNRSSLNSPAAVEYALASDFGIVYDGCSHTAGEEIGGTLLKRIVSVENLTIGRIKNIWAE
jgi:hypothetical protein